MITAFYEATTYATCMITEFCEATAYATCMITEGGARGGVVPAA
jgi:hypothetical protein